MTEETETER